MTQDSTHTRLEEALAEIQRLRALVSERERLVMLGQIAIGIAHELRQPLSVINSIAYCLRRVVKETGCENTPAPGMKTPPVVYLERLEDQVTTANRIITGLSEYARTQRPNISSTDLNQLVQREAARLELPPGVRVVQQLESGEVRTLADPLHLERIFHILASNALQSMEPAGGGELGFRTGGEPQAVTLQVSDTGTGVPEPLREKIFQPFFSSKASGLGLGLALARQLVEANGGTIGFQTRNGQGTVFEVRLPVAAAI